MEQGQQLNNAGLTKRFAVLGGLIMVMACIAIGYFSHEGVRRDLQKGAESNNVVLTRAFSNLVWDKYADFFDIAGSLDLEALHKHAAISALRAEVLSAMKGLPVLKVKIYDADGLTVFSTQETQIGEDKSGNAGFLAARGGAVASELTHRDSFSAFEQTVEDRDVLSSYVPILGETGNVAGVFEIYYDVTALLARTDRAQQIQLAVVTSLLAVLYVALVSLVWLSERARQRQHEENLRLARDAAIATESSRMKSDFMAHMSHHLRTPLNAIMGFSEVVKGQLFGPVGAPQYLDYAKDIWTCGQDLLSIVDNVLDMSKFESGRLEIKVENLEIRPLLNRVAASVENLAAAKGVKFSWTVPEAPLRLRADRNRVEQMLLNPLRNAIKFTPPGGSVSLSAERTRTGGLGVTVSDTGIGMRREDIPRVLAPFGHVSGPYTGTDGGAGLGLPIVKALADLHGASLDIDSEPNRGMRVRIEFPAARVIGDTIAAETPCIPAHAAAQGV